MPSPQSVNYQDTLNLILSAMHITASTAGWVGVGCGMIAMAFVFYTYRLAQEMVQGKLAPPSTDESPNVAKQNEVVIDNYEGGLGDKARNAELASKAKKGPDSFLASNGKRYADEAEYWRHLSKKATTHYREAANQKALASIEADFDGRYGPEQGPIHRSFSDKFKDLSFVKGSMKFYSDMHDELGPEFRERRRERERERVAAARAKSKEITKKKSKYKSLLDDGYSNVGPRDYAQEGGTRRKARYADHAERRRNHEEHYE